jgi:hypothetical protein
MALPYLIISYHMQPFFSVGFLYKYHVKNPSDTYAQGRRCIWEFLSLRGSEYVRNLSAHPFRGLSLGDFIDTLEAEGVPCGGGYGALYKDGMFQNPIKRRPVTRGSDYYSSAYLPNTEELSAKTIWIFHTVLLGSKNDMEDIIEAVAKIKDNIDELI